MNKNKFLIKLTNLFLEILNISKNRFVSLLLSL